MLVFSFRREFTLAEIEHFCDPSNKSHPKFGSVQDTKMLLYSACDQMDGKSPSIKTIGEAVNSVILWNFTYLVISSGNWSFIKQ